MSSGSDMQRADFSGSISGFQNLANSFNGYMREAYDWAKGQWKKQEPYSDEVQQIMLDQARQGAEWAQADRQRFEQVFKPIEDQYIREVQAYDTPGRRAQEAGRAAGAASQMAEANADEAKRQLVSFGVKPTDVRFGTLDLGTRMTKASMAAAAAEKARMDVEGRGLALRQGVVNLGGRYPGQAIANYGMSQSAGQTGTNVGLATDQTYGNLMGTAPQWGGLNVNALSGLTAATDAQYKADLAQNQANSQGSGGIGKLAGTIIGGAAGAYFGGPMGASVGANIGGQAGSMFSAARGGEVPGVIDITEDAGNYVDPSMSPSGGAKTDDVRAVIPGTGGRPAQPARIDAGEFIFPRRTTEYYGSKHLQGMIDKADQAMGLAPPKGSKGGGAQQRQASAGAPHATPGATPGVGMGFQSGGVIPFQGGGAVAPELAQWSAANDAAQTASLQAPERGWQDVGRDALRGMAAAGAAGGGGGGGGGEAKPSPLDAYSRYSLLPLPQVPASYEDGGPIRAYADEQGVYRDPRSGAAVDDDRRLRRALNNMREGEDGGDISIPIGRGRAYISPRREYDVLDIEGGYEHPVGRGGSVAVEGFGRKYIGPGGEHAKPDYGVGLRFRQRF